MTRNVTDATIMLNTLVAKDKSDSASIDSKIDYLSHLKIYGLKGKHIGIAHNLMGYHKKLDGVLSKQHFIANHLIFTS